jgi:protein-S-isoprenylcysteine O-methyltransferase Ste14
VSPLFTHEPAVWILIVVSTLIWRTAESAAEGRFSKTWSPTPPDGSFYWINLLLLVSLAGSIAAGFGQVAPIAGPPWWPVIAGTALLWAGFALRTWSILTLGRFFKLSVVIQDDHQVIDRGPYRMLRHPSYLGLIVAVTGFGLATGSWASAAIALFGMVAAFAVRIPIEERAMLRELGEPYASYMRRTARLVPWLY